MKISWICLCAFLIGACASPGTNESNHVEEATETEVSSAPVEVDSAETLEDTPSADLVIDKLEIKHTKIAKSAEGYVYDSGVSPNGKVEIQVDEMEPNTYVVIINTDSSSYDVPDLYVSPTRSVWSENSQYIVLNNEDLYAGSGSTDIAIIDVSTGAYTSISCEDIAKGVDMMGRNKFILSDIRFIGENEIHFRLGANYLGDSGHPGIDEARRQELGANFGVDDEILLGYFSLKILD